MHFGARAGRADARRRDAGDASEHRRGAATPQMPARRRAPTGCGSQARWLCCSLLTYQRVCSSLAPRQRAWEPAAKCTTYFLTDPKLRILSAVSPPPSALCFLRASPTWFDVTAAAVSSNFYERLGLRRDDPSRQQGALDPAAGGRQQPAYCRPHRPDRSGA